jgi:Transposase DDE domain
MELAAATESDVLPEWPESIVGRKYLQMLQTHVAALRESQPHGNQTLFLDDIFLAELLAFFNPTMRSLRTLEDFSQTRQAQEFLSVRKISRSTLSDAHRLIDPHLLQPLIRELTDEAQSRKVSLPDLPAHLQHVLAVDGSFFAVASRVAWAVAHRTNRQKSRASVRMDLHLNVATWLPEVIDVSGKDVSEPGHAQHCVTPGAIHVYDRGYFDFELISAHGQMDAWLILRMREPGSRSPKFSAASTCELTAEDREAGAVSDSRGRLTGSTHRTPPDLDLREVVVTSPDQPGGEIRLLTNLMDLPAWTIAMLYRWRWQIELFFRWLKVFANFSHLISHSPAGVLLNFYVAVIGVLLMYLHSGARPSKYAFSLLSLVAHGASTLEEIAPILAERERQSALARASAARRRAKKKQG